MKPQSELEKIGFKRVDNERSIAYFAQREGIVVGTYLIDLLLKETKGKNARICLHENPEATQHDMIILEYKGRGFPAHRHLDKSETLCILRGQVMLFIFEDDGNISSQRLLVPGSICRIGAKTWHKNEIISPVAIYYESKPGPFLGDVDREFATWSESK